MIKKIAVLGCGWFGFPLAKALQNEGFDILGATTSENKLILLEAAHIQPFLLKAQPNLQGKKIASFFSSDLLILNIPPSARKNPDAILFHIAQIEAVAEKILEFGTKKAIFISSTGIYAEKKIIIDEKCEEYASSNAALALQGVESILKNLMEKDLTILRFGGLVGENRLAGRFFAGKKDLPNGRAPVNMLHLEDAIAICMETIKKQIFGETFNVCSDKHPEKKIFYTQQSLKYGFEPPQFKDELLDWKIISNQKIKATLNFQFKYPNPIDF